MKKRYTTIRLSGLSKNSKQVETVAWWKGEAVYQPGPLSFEALLRLVGFENLLMDIGANKETLGGVTHEVLSIPDVKLAHHWDAVMFTGVSHPMTELK